LRTDRQHRPWKKEALRWPEKNSNIDEPVKSPKSLEAVNIEFQRRAHPIKTLIHLLALVLLFVCSTSVHAQEYGKIRALQQRVTQVIQQKNDFVAGVLTSYAIPHELNAQGIVTRISMDGRWLNVTAIDIVPITGEMSGKNRRLAYHELLFHTADGVLDLLSDLAVR
jgi:hypothetical protein